jgi:hypothetical protein
MPIVFRWSVWGQKQEIVEMLPYSIGTFHRAFGTDAQYIVCTDEVSEMKSILGDYVDVIPLFEGEGNVFDVKTAATWRKWCPRPRLRPENTEVYVDADVFLVGCPVELQRFSANPARTYLVMQEAAGSRHWVGRFGVRIWGNIPPVNIGLVGQRAGTDITADLLTELQWWLANVPVHERQYHDDQGAVVAILAREHILGRLELLPQERYCIINHRHNSHLTSLDGVTAVHATMGHSAFRRFRAPIEAYIRG